MIGGKDLMWFEDFMISIRLFDEVVCVLLHLLLNSPLMFLPTYHLLSHFLWILYFEWCTYWPIPYLQTDNGGLKAISSFGSRHLVFNGIETCVVASGRTLWLWRGTGSVWRHSLISNNDHLRDSVFVTCSYSSRDWNGWVDGVRLIHNGVPLGGFTSSMDGTSFGLGWKI